MHLRTDLVGSRVGLAPGGLFFYLLRPGGRSGAIPTKTPDFPHQFLTSCRLSFRQFFQVWRTVFGSTDFFLKIFVFVLRLSILSRVFIAWSHLLWISYLVWSFVVSFPQVIALSQRIFHIRYMDSETMILKRRFRPLSGFPFGFRNFVRPHPSRAP